MRFSIIIPTYNRVRLIKRCLDSIIDQDYDRKRYEIVVINDGSTDDTQEFLEKEKRKMKNFRFYKIKNSGPGAARNYGLKKSKGRYIAFTDDDCIVEKEWLKKIEEKFIETNTDAVGGSIENPTDRYIAWAQYILNFSSWFPYKKERYVKDIPTANIVYKKKSIKKLKFPEDIRNGVYEDSLFNFELIKMNKKILFCPDIKVKHYTWEEDYSFKKFFKIQRKSAIGFLYGGYKVHGNIGKILLRIKILNLLCPRLILVFYRCLKGGYLIKFIFHFPLIILGEFYKGIAICFHKDIRNLKNE